MVVITIILFTICLLGFLTGLALLVKFIYKLWISSPKRKNNENQYLNWWVWYLVTLVGLLVVFSVAAPIIFTFEGVNSRFDFTKTGAIGDTIGGLMNPFIAFAGVIVTGLAFYMQYKANQIQRELSDKAIEESKKQFNQQLTEQLKVNEFQKNISNKTIEENQKQFQKQLEEQEKQYKIQQFESQFFEMLRLHKENVNEIQYTTPDDLIRNGRIVFNYDMVELHRIINSIINPVIAESKIFGEAVNKGEKPTQEEVWKKKFEFAYSLFFGESLGHLTLKYVVGNFHSR